MSKIIEIDSRWEPLIDRLLIDELDGAVHRLLPPVRREVVLTHDAPCECSTSYYHNFVVEDARIRVYYRGLYDPSQTTNMAESVDGIHFTRPQLGQYEINGSARNNVVWEGIGGHNLCVFRDDSPNAADDARYKAVGSARSELYAFASADGLRWRLLQDEPLAIPGAFDSLNVPFWDPRKQCYRLFSRYFDERKVRAIQSCESTDFSNWTEPVPHQYAAGVPSEHFYTNATVPCPGAEHILLSFPKRFIPDRTLDTEGMDYAAQGVSDAVFMSSRDGIHWDRSFLEAWLTPGLEKENWTHRNLLTATGIVATGPHEWSLYVGEHYGWLSNRLRRLTVRPLGLACVAAGAAGGEWLTPALRLTGRQLELNYSTSAAGSVTIEICDLQGHTLPALPALEAIYGDQLAAVVGADLSALQGQPVRLRFKLQDAQVYALRVR